MEENSARILDLYDALIRQFAPIEQLFKVMNGVDQLATIGGGELVLF